MKFAFGDYVVLSESRRPVDLNLVAAGVAVCGSHLQSSAAEEVDKPLQSASRRLRQVRRGCTEDCELVDHFTSICENEETNHIRKL
ncbi:hypothetical protein LXL04_021587 [Taraxacum kok-saghyz]